MKMPGSVEATQLRIDARDSDGDGIDDQMVLKVFDSAYNDVGTQDHRYLSLISMRRRIYICNAFIGGKYFCGGSFHHLIRSRLMDRMLFRLISG